MRITLVGSRHFGVTTLNMLREHGVSIVRVVVADAEDRLAATAKAAGIEVVVQADPKLVVASEIAPDTDLIITAHSHARIGKDALAAARLGGIGYHPSLLPRHRGKAAVEWTIKEGDPIAGGTVYRAPRELSADRVNRLVKVTDVPGFLTDGAMVGPGRVVLRGYRSATLWTFPDFRPLTTFRLPKQQQGESISVGPGGRVLIGSEGSRSVVLSVKLPPACFSSNQRK